MPQPSSFAACVDGILSTPHSPGVSAEFLDVMTLLRSGCPRSAGVRGQSKHYDANRILLCGCLLLAAGQCPRYRGRGLVGIALGCCRGSSDGEAGRRRADGARGRREAHPTGKRRRGRAESYRYVGTSSSTPPRSADSCATMPAALHCAARTVPTCGSRASTMELTNSLTR